ncbi:MAG: DNA-directed RNA polymerase subunit omega [Leucobacter sp.]
MAQVNGIIDPPIDDLLEKVDSKYALVIFASQRARQINDYYTDLHDGNLFDNVGPLVDASVDDKPLSTALHEIVEGKLVMNRRAPQAEETAVAVALEEAGDTAAE